MAKSYAFEIGELSPIEVAEIRHDPNHSLYTIPWGPQVGKKVVKKLINMNWKGRRGPEFKEKAKEHGMLLQANEFAKKVSQKFGGVKGRIMYMGFPYPKKAIAQKFWREIKELETAYAESRLEGAASNVRKNKYAKPSAEVEAILAKLR